MRAFRFYRRSWALLTTPGVFIYTSCSATFSRVTPPGYATPLQLNYISPVWPVFGLGASDGYAFRASQLLATLFRNAGAMLLPAYPSSRQTSPHPLCRALDCTVLPVLSPGISSSCSDLLGGSFELAGPTPTFIAGARVPRCSLLLRSALGLMRPHRRVGARRRNQRFLSTRYALFLFRGLQLRTLSFLRRKRTKGRVFKGLRRGLAPGTYLLYLRFW